MISNSALVKHLPEVDELANRTASQFWVRIPGPEMGLLTSAPIKLNPAISSEVKGSVLTPAGIPVLQGSVVGGATEDMGVPPNSA
jgi:hypothetical protein